MTGAIWADRLQESQGREIAPGSHFRLCRLQIERDFRKVDIGLGDEVEVIRIDIERDTGDDLDNLTVRVSGLAQTSKILPEAVAAFDDHVPGKSQAGGRFLIV